MGDADAQRHIDYLKEIIFQTSKNQIRKPVKQNIELWNQDHSLAVS